MKIVKDFLRHRLRSGRAFQRWLQELQQSEKFSTAEIECYQNDALRRTIKTAYDSVPFYRKAFDEYHLKLADIRTVADLQKFPFIDKKTVRENFKLFRNRRFKGLTYKGLTSGTTGTPGVFLRDLNSINFENAAVWRSWMWGGKEPRTKRITIRGDLICSIERKEPPFWRENKFSRELLMSGYHLSEANMPFYIGAIAQYQPDDLYAYPSTAYLLAEYCLRHRIKVPLKAVFTSSEMLFNHQRETIEQAFACKIFDWYGQAERVSAIATCEYGQYHIMDDYSITELIPAGDGRFEIVGTTLFNTVMPLIRYRMGDYVQSKTELCLCKRAFRTVQGIDGREGSYLNTPSGSLIGIVNHIPRGVNNLIELQFVQESLYEIKLRIVCTANFSQHDESKLLDNAREHISKDIKFVIERVPYIPRTQTGKFKPVVTAAY